MRCFCGELADDDGNTHPLRPFLFREGCVVLLKYMKIGNKGERTMIPYNTNLIPLARKNRKKQTPAERKMWFEVLRGRKLAGFKFTRQKPLNTFIADFYCAELLLVIEIDGLYHNEQKEYDEFRSQVLWESHGILVLRCKNEDILNRIEKVKKQLEVVIEKRKAWLNSPIS